LGVHLTLTSGMRRQPAMQPIVRLILLFANVFAGPASAQDLHPGIIGEDDRVRVDERGPPWDAVGQVNIGGYRIAGRCTGTMVGANLVLTAAHCVINPWSRTPFPLRDIHFLAGVRGSQNKGHSTAKCLHFATGNTLAKDVVAIVLKENLTVAPVTLDHGVIPEHGLLLIHAAYPADRRFALRAHYDCHLLRFEPAPLWLNDCDTDPASSGGPLFTRADGVLKLAAIMIGMGGGGANTAVPLSEWEQLTRNGACP
jgi:protease YdgD